MSVKYLWLSWTAHRTLSKEASKQASMQVSGHGSNQVLLLILSGGYLLVAVKIASSIFVNQPNATKPKSSETQFKFQFELSLAQLSPSLL